MNPSPSLAAYIEGAERLDPVSAASEYGAEFRDDAGGYLSRDVINACIDWDLTERPPVFNDDNDSPRGAVLVTPDGR